ncbi:MAG: VWA domain-containing protein [Planctomycetota bacterium]
MNDEIVWRNGAAFWLLWILPVLAGLAVLAHRGVRQAARRFAGAVMTPRLLPPLDASGPLGKTALLTGGIALAVVAAARPAWDVYYLQTGARGLDLVVALDVSRSMLADDRGDSRLGRAKSAISWLVQELPGDRAGLLLFAGTTTRACPLTLDRGFFETSLRAANPDSVGRGGTKIGPALEDALRMLDTSWDRDKLVLLVTDGGDQESFPKTAAEALRKKNVRVLSLGLGQAEEGAPLVLDGQIVRRKDGQPVMARLNDGLLKELAVDTQGMYVPPEEAHRLAALYRENFGHLRRGQNQELQEKHYREKYQWFLIAGLVLLLLQAGRSGYRRRRAGDGQQGAGVAGAAAALPLALLFALGACGDTSRVQAALDQLGRGEAENAEQALLELADELPDEPVVAYDLACAHQMRERRREARRRYVDVLERGDKKLRARAHTNLAMLAVGELRARAGDDPAGLETTARGQVQQLAEQALDELQRARNLDPKLDEATRRQDLLARWLRVTEASWRERDRQAAREARAQKSGAGYLRALIDAQRELVRNLAGGEMLEDLELVQRDLLEELPATKDHFADEGAALAEAFHEEVASGLDDAAQHMTAALDLLQAAQPDGAAAAMTRAAAAMVTQWVLWADLGAGIADVATAQEQFVAGLRQQLARSVQPGADDEAIAAALAVAVARERELLRERGEQAAAAAGNLARRLEPQHAVESWSPIFVRRAAERFPDLLQRIERSIARLDAKGPQAVIAAEQAARTLRGLALEWELAGMEVGPLAERFETEQAELVRSAAGVQLGEERRERPSGLLAKLRDAGSGLLRSIAWSPLRGAQSEQADRTEYLRAAWERKEAAEAAQAAAAHQGTPAGGGDSPPPGDQGAPPVEDPAVAEQSEARKAWMDASLGRVREAMTRAYGAMAAGPEPEAIAAMHEARAAVREVWTSLAEFDALLRRAASEQEPLAATSEQMAEMATDDDPAGLTAQLRFALGDSTRQQELTARLVQLLRAGLTGRVRQLEEQLEAAKAEASAAPQIDVEELENELEVSRTLDELLSPAADAALGAATALRQEPAPTEMAALQERLADAAPDQRQAADLLAEALQRLAEAGLPLAELARRIMEGETQLLTAARELAAERTPTLNSGESIAWPDLKEAQDSAGAYVDRLARALERELAQAAQAQQQAPGAGPVPSSIGEAEAALRAQVDDVEASYRESLKWLAKEGEEAQSLDFIGATLDASRGLWAGVAKFEDVLERAVGEESALKPRTEAMARETQAADAGGGAAAAEDQARTRAMIPALQEHVAAMKQQQAEQANAAPPNGSPPNGAAPPPAAGGLSPEVIELAERNLPAADAAMAEAETQLGAASWNDALDRIEEAERLLQEILDALRDQQDEDQEQDQQQQQQQQQQPSPEELERRRRAVEERNLQQQQRHRQRTPVEEDW